MTLYVVIIILTALAFDFINGFHDAANSVATVVSTRVLSPKVAVLWAGAFNFLSFLVFEPKVAAAIAKGIDAPVTLNVVFATLLGAIVWNLLTWWWGLPSSSSHALMGAFAGAALMHVPRLSILNSVFVTVVIFILVAPLMGMVLGWLIMHGLRLALGRMAPGKVDSWFRRGQLVSAAAYSLGHGGNDAQKTMGIITLVLVTAKLQPASQSLPSFWVVISCQAAMGLGTLSGGWRIVKTMGMKIAKLKPVGGFAAETAGAITLAMSTMLKVPVSTTHTITGAIVGVGSTEGRRSAVRWGIAGRIVWAWLLTIPAAAAMACACYFLLRLVTGSD